MEAKKSIRCPLTLCIMKKPVKSTICGHTFDRDAIFSYILTQQRQNMSTSPDEEVDTDKKIECPMPGCSNEITTFKLVVDLDIQQLLQQNENKNNNNNNNNNRNDDNYTSINAKKALKVVELFSDSDDDQDEDRDANDNDNDDANVTMDNNVDELGLINMNSSSSPTTVGSIIWNSPVDMPQNRLHLDLETGFDEISYDNGDGDGEEDEDDDSDIEILS